MACTARSRCAGTQTATGKVRRRYFSSIPPRVVKGELLPKVVKGRIRAGVVECTPKVKQEEWGSSRGEDRCPRTDRVEIACTIGARVFGRARLRLQPGPDGFEQPEAHRAVV